MKKVKHEKTILKNPQKYRKINSRNLNSNKQLHKKNLK